MTENYKIDLSKDFFGKSCSIPLIMSPVGGTDQFHKKSEFIFSDVAEKNEIPYFIFWLWKSTISKSHLTEVLVIRKPPF